MNLYRISRKAGYGELQSALVRAESEDAARLAIIRLNSGMSGIDDFASPEHSTAVVVTDDEVGVLHQSFASS